MKAMLLHSASGGGGGGDAHHQMQHAAAWMIMKMGDNANGPEDDKNNNKYNDDDDDDDDNVRKVLAQSQGKKCDQLQCAPNFNWASTDQRPETEDRRPRSNGQSFSNGWPWHSGNTYSCY
ncbi:uncharacterized protein Dvir_GJ26450 [Drosophila virilis]|uniref:Uncharacterized protein n=1 Tax=Drosophila virilis TaxID=7244 RepID=A0A0Q9WID8_DROVI|nr:uncharacterized protein Dvir_GJ26450 [Drosophila virilis]